MEKDHGEYQYSKFVFPCLSQVQPNDLEVNFLTFSDSQDKKNCQDKK